MSEKMKCKEILFVRNEPYARRGSCISQARKIFSQVYPHPDYFDDIMETEVRIHRPHIFDCDFEIQAPKECEGIPTKDCIMKYGEYSTREWCFDKELTYRPYKYGLEINCNEGIIYAYYCESE